jgi:hypothetical protein
MSDRMHAVAGTVVQCLGIAWSWSFGEEGCNRAKSYPESCAVSRGTATTRQQTRLGPSVLYNTGLCNSSNGPAAAAAVFAVHRTLYLPCTGH